MHSLAPEKTAARAYVTRSIETGVMRGCARRLSQLQPERRGCAEDHTVFIVDSDASVRQSLQDLLESVRLRSEAFESPGEFRRRALPEIPSCIILDVRLPGVSGLDFQRQLAHDGIQLPVIFLTGHGDISMTVRAMKAGAVDFLAKPCREQDLLDAVMAGIEQDRKRRDEIAKLRTLQQRYLAITERERQVMSLVTAGLMNKQIAAELGLSECTVKVHRGNLMRKLDARSVPGLVRISDLLGARSTDSAAPRFLE